MTEEKKIRIVAGVQLIFCFFAILLGLCQEIRQEKKFTKRTKKQQKKLNAIAFRADKKIARLTEKKRILQAEKKAKNK